MLQRAVVLVGEPGALALHLGEQLGRAHEEVKMERARTMELGGGEILERSEPLARRAQERLQVTLREPARQNQSGTFRHVVQLGELHRAPPERSEDRPTADAVGGAAAAERRQVVGSERIVGRVRLATRLVV